MSGTKISGTQKVIRKWRMICCLRRHKASKRKIHNTGIVCACKSTVPASLEMTEMKAARLLPTLCCFDEGAAKPTPSSPARLGRFYGGRHRPLPDNLQELGSPQAPRLLRDR